MRRPPRLLPLLVPVAALAVGFALGRGGRGPDPASLAEAWRPAGAAAPVAAALRQEALELYASGQYARACERFSAAGSEVAATPGWRQDVGRCFDSWGRAALRAGRSGEAMLLFRQGLAALPDDPGLLTGLGLAAIHDGRRAEALPALEQAVALEDDPDVRLLLVRLYDSQDEADRALVHLRALLARQPEHETARGLLRKLERERRAEAAFARRATDHFVVRHEASADEAAVGEVVEALEAAWGRMAEALGYRPSERLAVILYASARFRDVTGVHDWVTGLYDGKIRLPLGPGLPRGEALERVVLHEYAHAAIHEVSRGRAPRWLQEGLAQYLEGARADGLLPLPGTLTLTGLEALVGDTDPLRARAGYDISLWATEDLLARGGLPAMRALLGRLAAGERLPAALIRVYGLRLSELEAQWRHLLGG